MMMWERSYSKMVCSHGDFHIPGLDNQPTDGANQVVLLVSLVASTRL